MPETSTKTATSFVFDKKKCQDHLDKVIEYQNRFVGMKLHNPFLWIRKNVTPLYNRLAGILPSGERCVPETTKELQDAILAIPLEEEPIVITVTEPPAEEQVQHTMKMTPQGILVDDKALKRIRES